MKLASASNGTPSSQSKPPCQAGSATKTATATVADVLECYPELLEMEVRSQNSFVVTAGRRGFKHRHFQWRTSTYQHAVSFGKIPFLVRTKRKTHIVIFLECINRWLHHLCWRVVNHMDIRSHLS